MIGASIGFLGIMLSNPAFAAGDDGVDGDYAVLDEGQSGPPGWPVIQFDANRDGLHVATILGTSVGSAGGTTVAVTSYQDLCLTPCLLTIRPGLRKFSYYGNGRTPGGIELDLRKDSNLRVYDKSGSLAAAYLGTFSLVWGLIGAGIGIPLWVIGGDDSPGLKKAGVLATTIGGGMMVVGVPLVILGGSKVTYGKR